MKIILDTNCLLVSIPKQSKFRWAWDAFRRKDFILCYSNEILEEYNEIIADFYSPTLAENIILEILNSSNTEQVDVFYKWNLIKDDPDDNKFIDAAINSGAEFIITHDKHFNVLNDIEFPKVSIADLHKFKEILSK